MGNFLRQKDISFKIQVQIGNPYQRHILCMLSDTDFSSNHFSQQT